MRTVAIKKFEDYRVEEDYMSNLEYIKEFELLSKEYKMGCEFEHVEGLKFKFLKETPTIYCYNHKVAIYPKNSEICEAHIMTSVNFEKRLESIGLEMIEHEMELMDGSKTKVKQFGESGEFIIQFYTKDIEKVVDVFKIRKARTQHTNPHSHRNLHDFLRFQRNINSWYGDILEERILANRDEDSED